jgi:metal-dependent amidase/aminoacylase/carboxypeptidase family protein
VSRRAIFLCLILMCMFLGVPPAHSQQATLDVLLDREMPSLLSTYKALHAAPELSHQEEKTSALVAGELRALGYTVTERVGKYAEHPDWVSYGVMGELKNGNGPTVYVRTELDALPVEEMTGLPYASKVRTKDDAGREVGVMHACGHDIHITSFLGTAKMLMELKDQWHGTLVMLAQPAEEAIDGAKAMLDDGLYTRFRRPDYVLALHDSLGRGGQGRIHAGLRDGQLDFRRCHSARHRRPRFRPANGQGPHCGSCAVHPGDSDHREPGGFAL